jgi:dTDP-4-amino-4,6-dideoxygalactose transaminase
MTDPKPRVPLLDLRAQYASIRDEVDAAIRGVVESQAFILGPEVDALEREIAAYCRARFAVGCASGSDALLLALVALGVEPGDEVICPAYTFFATGGAIARLGAVPVFADIEPFSYNLDPEAARAAARRCKRLKALMPVHLFGQSADLAAFESLGRVLGVPVIEDAAQAIGTCDAQGQRIGARGAIACFSFFPSKNLGAFGDGGMCTTNDARLADLMSIQRQHGSRPKYHHHVFGVNSRLDALHAAVLRVKLRHLDRWTAGRQANAAWYDRAFAAAGASTTATPIEDGGFPLRTPAPVTGPRERHIYNQYVIAVPAGTRDALRAELTAKGIGTEVYYPVPIHLQECFSQLGGRPGDLPHTEAAADRTIALPIYAELTAEQKEHVVRTIVAFASAHAAMAMR